MPADNDPLRAREGTRGNQRASCWSASRRGQRASRVERLGFSLLSGCLVKAHQNCGAETPAFRLGEEAPLPPFPCEWPVIACSRRNKTLTRTICCKAGC